MKIAVLGGGFTGLTAAYYLRRAGHDVTLYEQSSVLGGLAVGFKVTGWNWYLERAYHHLFSNDTDILQLAKDTGFTDIFFQSPITASLYSVNGNYRTFPLDTPQDLLRFPLLSIPERIRTGAVLGFLKYAPFLPLYEQQSAKQVLHRYMGPRAYEVMFSELFRKKFGTYADKILTSFIWARITKRTKDLGYVRGGFQTFIDHLERTIKKQGAEVAMGVKVKGIVAAGDGFLVRIEALGSGETRTESFDRVISTLPTPITASVGADIFPAHFLKNLRSIEYLHAVCLILETKKPILEKAYWLNICVPELPAMLVAQHTNLVDMKYYGGNHIAYTANYVSGDDPLVKMPEEKVISHYVDQLKKVSPGYTGSYSRSFVFKAPFAQPIFDKNFLKHKPDFETPAPGFFIANLDMTYPYDRGTNYAVALGRKVVEYIQ